MSSERRLDFGMFHRRLIALTVVFVLVILGLAGRLWGLTVIDGARHLDVAESRMDREKLLPTWRGTIRDRKGRILAQDVPSYDLAIRFPVLDGSWAKERAREEARAALGTSAWAKLKESDRSAEIAMRLPQWDKRADMLLTQLAELAEMPRSELDASIAEIVSRVNRKVAAVHRRQVDLRRERYGPESVENFAPEPIREQLEAHVIKAGVPDEIAFAARRIADINPRTIEVIDSATRHYPESEQVVEMPRDDLPRPLQSAAVQRVTLKGVADHILGGVRTDVWEDDIRRRPFEDRDESGVLVIDFGGYRPGRDQIGNRGVEESCEDLLRGQRGEVVKRLDTGEEVRRDPIAGSSLQLSIDVKLQARIEAAIHPDYGLSVVQPWHLGYSGGVPKAGPMPFGTQLATGVVVLDIDSGEILAMASGPSLAQGADLTTEERKRLLPHVNRALNAAYAPGSVLKPLVYTAAVAEGVFQPDERISCTGHYFKERKDVARCWIYRPEYKNTNHDAKVGGPLRVEDAISRSCNIFFYTLAGRLGATRLVNWYREFGLGAVTDCGLSSVNFSADGRQVFPDESAGALPAAADLQVLEDKHDAFTTIIMGIGQGPITWTPIQAASSYATIARNGRYLPPSIFRGPRVDGHGGTPRQLSLDSRSLPLLMEGMRQSVEEFHGTGHRLVFADGTAQAVVKVKGVEVWAKTGTAQAPGSRKDVDEDGTTDKVQASPDHAWFVGLVGDSSTRRAQYAIAVVVEHGGPGGRAAGPIAAAVIRALLEEGYLAGDRNSGDPTL